MIEVWTHVSSDHEVRKAIGDDPMSGVTSNELP